jgi:hypothetical protein
MFQILSDLSLLLRKELTLSTAAPDIVGSGLSGSWVTLDTDGTARLTGVVPTELAWPVFNESKRDGTVGWTPDVTNASIVTIIAGKFFARTDRYTGVSTVGPLKTAAGGLLQPAVEGTVTDVVAYCVKAPYSTTYLGRTLTVIDIYVL